MTKTIQARNKKFLKLYYMIKKITEILTEKKKRNRRRPRKFNLFQIIAP
jgi:hypothetical protein